MRDFHFPGRSPSYATNGMAATSMPAATLAALDVLRAGGNALDAAVAAVAVLCVIEPASTGIGGDCFCLYAPRGGYPVVALNGSGRAPAAAAIDWYEGQGMTALDPISAHSVTVPGAISAWETLLAAHGTKGLDELLRPATALAEDGFAVHSRVAHDWASGVSRLRANGSDAFLPNGGAPSAGDIFRNVPLAETLRQIGRHGARAFYEGPVAADMVAALRARGGLHTLEDFARGRTAAEFVDPITAPWHGHDVWQCPPNGSGLLVLMMLGILEGFGPAPDGPLGLIRLHRHLEAARLVYRDRDAFLADPAQVEVPVARLTDPAYLASLRRLIRDDVAMPHLPAPGESALPVHRDTVYLCVVDRDGNACSFINSLFQGFGSAILAPRSGVMLQNRGYGFRIQRGHPNCIAPNKRPMHTIIPGMVTKGGVPVMPYGVMGGHFQPMGQTLFLTNHFDYGLDIQEALDLPRIFAVGGKVEAERGIPAHVLARLAAMGHEVGPVEKPHGGGQAIWIDHERGCLIGGSDPRKDGMALGYRGLIRMIPVVLARLALGATLILPAFLMHGRAVAEILIGLVDLCFLARCALAHDWTWLASRWVRVGAVWWGWLVVCSIPAISGGNAGNLMQAAAIGRFLVFVAALEHDVLKPAAARLWMRWVVIATALYIGLQSLLQFVTGHDLQGFPRGPDGELTGPFEHPRAAAPLSRLLFPAVLATGNLKLVLPVIIAATGIVVLIGQRMPLLLTLLGLVLTGLLLPRLRAAMLAAIVTGGVLLGASVVISPPTFHRLVVKFSAQMEDFPDSDYGRIAGRAIAITVAHPIFGQGFDAYRRVCGDPVYGDEAEHAPATSTRTTTTSKPPPKAAFPAVLFCGLILAWLAPLARGLWRNPTPLRVGLFVAAFIQEWPIASTSGFTAIEIGGFFFLLLGFGLAEACAAT